MAKRIGLGVVIALVLTMLIGAQGVWAAPPQWGPVHIVRCGETLSGIAVRFGVSVGALARANGIVNPNRIFAGQRLVIPAGNMGTVHVVRCGETLSGIAFHYGVNMWSIANANGIHNINRIFAGQRLTIPGV